MADHGHKIWNSPCWTNHDRPKYHQIYIYIYTYIHNYIHIYYILLYIPFVPVLWYLYLVEDSLVFFPSWQVLFLCLANRYNPKHNLTKQLHSQVLFDSKLAVQVCDVNCVGCCFVGEIPSNRGNVEAKQCGVKRC